MVEILCNSCKISISNSVGTAVFPCPKCTKTKIVRCRKCREIAAEYACTECGFTGPA